MISFLAYSTCNFIDGSLLTLLFLICLLIKKPKNFTIKTIAIHTNIIRKSCPVLDKKSASGTMMPNFPGVYEYYCLFYDEVENICGKNK